MSRVYVFDFEDKVKVGYTTDLRNRQKQIQRTLKKKAAKAFSIEAPLEVEALAHKELEPYKIHGEYYSCSFDLACATVKAAKRAIPKKPKPDKSSKVYFTMVMDVELAHKLDYIRECYGRSRTKEIEWACKEWVKKFEEEVDKIELEDA